MELIIHDRIKSIISQLCDRQKVASCYIFSGPKGSFPDHAARFFAWGLNCTSLTHSGPCLTCQACKIMQRESPIDYYTFSDENSIKIDAIRAINKMICHGPHQLKKYIVFIPHANRLTEQAANALLKKLEEPPENVCFILSCHEKHRLLCTILSRAQQVDLPQIPLLQLKPLIKKLSKETQAKITTLQNNHATAIGYVLESPENTMYLDDFMSFKTLLETPLFDRLLLAESASEKKEKALFFLTLWQHECLESLSSDSNDTLSHLTFIIDYIHALTYHLNLRLHMETFMQKIPLRVRL